MRIETFSPTGWVRVAKEHPYRRLGQPNDDAERAEDAEKRLSGQANVFYVAFRDPQDRHKVTEDIQRVANDAGEFAAKNGADAVVVAYIDGGHFTVHGVTFEDRVRLVLVAPLGSCTNVVISGCSFGAVSAGHIAVEVIEEEA